MLSVELNNKIFFMIMHRNGLLIYSYPTMKEEYVLLSSLMSAIRALVDNIVGDYGDRPIEIRFGSYRGTLVKKGELIYSIFTGLGLPMHCGEILESLIEIAEYNFPAEIKDDVVISKHAFALDAAIELYLSTVAQYMSRGSYDYVDDDFDSIWILTDMPNIKLVKEVYEALIKGRAVFIHHKNVRRAYIIARYISNMVQNNTKVRIVRSDEINYVDLSETAIYIIKGDMKERLSKTILEQSLFIELDRDADGSGQPTTNKKVVAISH